MGDGGAVSAHTPVPWRAWHGWSCDRAAGGGHAGIGRPGRPRRRGGARLPVAVGRVGWRPRQRRAASALLPVVPNFPLGLVASLLPPPLRSALIDRIALLRSIATDIAAARTTSTLSTVRLTHIYARACLPSLPSPARLGPPTRSAPRPFHADAAAAVPTAGG